MNCKEKPMKPLILLVLASVTTLAGCSTPTARADDPGSVIAITSVKLVARQAVARYIQEHGPGAAFDRATRVKRVAEGVLSVLEGDTEVTVTALKAAALAAIPSTYTLTPADQLLARDLIDALGALITKYVGEGKLDPQKTVVVRDALVWIVDAAAYFAPPA
jgi:hypothetical protein